MLYCTSFLWIVTAKLDRSWAILRPSLLVLLHFGDHRLVDGTEICDGRNTISKAISEPGALELAEFIRKLTSLSREERARIIRRKLRQSLNTTAAVQRFRRFNRLLYWPDWEARQLLFTLLVLLPASIWIAGWRRAWIMALACILFSIRQIFVFVQVHRVFQKNSTSARRSRVLALALAPPATIRVRDFLSRELLERFHPLAVARAVCSEEDSRQFTSIEFRKLKFPAAFEKSDTRCPVESWIREEWLKAVQDWAGTEFVDFRLLLQAPERQHPASQSYCPRCLQEYTQSGGECPDCPGVAREPLAPSSDSSL